jgi:hypothetical protein
MSMAAISCYLKPNYAIPALMITGVLSPEAWHGS